MITEEGEVTVNLSFKVTVGDDSIEDAHRKALEVLGRHLLRALQAIGGQTLVVTIRSGSVNIDTMAILAYDAVQENHREAIRLIRKRAKHAKLNIRDLSRILGICTAQISRMVRGHASVSSKSQHLLIAALPKLDFLSAEDRVRLNTLLK